MHEMIQTVKPLFIQCSIFGLLFFMQKGCNTNSCLYTLLTFSIKIDRYLQTILILEFQQKQKQQKQQQQYKSHAFKMNGLYLHILIVEVCIEYQKKLFKVFFYIFFLQFVFFRFSQLFFAFQVSFMCSRHQCVDRKRSSSLEIQAKNEIFFFPSFSLLLEHPPPPHTLFLSNTHFLDLTLSLSQGVSLSFSPVLQFCIRLSVSFIVKKQNLYQLTKSYEYNHNVIESLLKTLPQTLCIKVNTQTYL